MLTYFLASLVLELAVFTAKVAVVSVAAWGVGRCLIKAHHKH